MPFERQVNILLDIDQICDQAKDESTLALQLVAYLAETVDADLAAFSLPDEQEPGEWKLQAVTDRGEVLGTMPISHLNEVAEEAIKIPSHQMLEHAVPSANGLPPVYLLAAPQFLNGEILGVLLLAQLGTAFDAEAKRIVEIASSRMDSALRHIRTLQRWQEEATALQTVLAVDRIRDTSLSLDELLDKSLTEVTQVIAAQAGFIMLYDRQGNRLELRALTGHDFEDAGDELFQKLYQFADEAITAGDVTHWPPRESQLRTVLGVPLILNERVVGVLGIFNPLKRKNFTPHDRRLLEAIASQMDTAIFERLETQRIREVFGRNVGSKVMNRLLQSADRDLLEGERVEITVLFSDIRGFTSVSAKTDPAVMEDVINAHFEAMTKVIHKHEGTLDKFLGDGIMAFFNAPERQAQHAHMAVETALAMQAAHDEWRQTWIEQGLPDMPIGIGIATGEVIVGNFGSKAHAEYSAIGSTVNLAARLCEDAQGGQILINQRACELVGNEFSFEELAPKIFKGFDDPMPVWLVAGARQ